MSGVRSGCGRTEWLLVFGTWTAAGSFVAALGLGCAGELPEPEMERAELALVATPDWALAPDPLEAPERDTVRNDEVVRPIGSGRDETEPAAMCSTVSSDREDDVEPFPVPDERMRYDLPDPASPELPGSREYVDHVPAELRQLAVEALTDGAWARDSTHDGRAAEKLALLLALEEAWLTTHMPEAVGVPPAGP